MTLKKQDFRRNKHEEDQDNSKLKRRHGGYTPTVRKLKPAGKCQEGIPLYYVNGGDVPEHALTPADTPSIRAHKLSCPN